MIYNLFMWGSYSQLGTSVKLVFQSNGKSSVLTSKLIPCHLVCMSSNRQPYLDQKVQQCPRPTVRVSQLLLHQHWLDQVSPMCTEIDHRVPPQADLTNLINMTSTHMNTFDILKKKLIYFWSYFLGAVYFSLYCKCRINLFLYTRFLSKTAISFHLTFYWVLNSTWAAVSSKHVVLLLKMAL